MVKSLLVVLLCFILPTEHLRRYTYECITNGNPLPTRVQTFHFVCSTFNYCSTAYKTLLANQYSRCMPRKMSLNLVHYCTLLSMVCHFDVCNHNTYFASHFVLKRAVKLNGFTSKQYRQTTPLICAILFMWLALWK